MELLHILLQITTLYSIPLLSTSKSLKILKFKNLKLGLAALLLFLLSHLELRDRHTSVGGATSDLVHDGGKRTGIDLDTVFHADERQLLLLTLGLGRLDEHHAREFEGFDITTLVVSSLSLGLYEHLLDLRL